MKTFVIAEAGVNHNGSDRLAMEMVQVAADCGADAIKFQTFSADKLVRRGAAKAAYQAAATGAGDQHAMLKSLEMSVDLHRALFTQCDRVGIEFMSTPFDEEAAAFLISMGMRRIKIASGEITNHPLLTFLASHGLPVILSTGMADLEEIKSAVTIIEAAQVVVPVTSSGPELTVLHCTSNYPAQYSDVNLRAMRTIADDTGLAVGYSDHTLGIAVATAAVALGAQVIEKHFTLDRDLAGPDHKASLTPADLRAMIEQIRAVEAAMGSAVKAPTASELPIRALVRRSVTAAQDIAAGTVVTDGALTLLRPGDGIPPSAMNSVVGRVAARAIPAGSTMQWDDLA
jgi:N,N'-diacetyllegionaminate synthase